MEVDEGCSGSDLDYLDHKSDGDVGSENGISGDDLEDNEGGGHSVDYYAMEPACSIYPTFRLPPTHEATKKALDDIKLLLKPRRKKKTGYLWAILPPMLRERLERMRLLLWTFIDRTKPTRTQGRPCGPQWMSASLTTAHTHEKGPYYARQLCSWTKAFISDRDELPFDLYGASKISKLNDEELTSELHAHLQSVGKFVKAANLVQYISDNNVQKQFGFKSTISLATAKRWMHVLGYCWKSNHHGQYVDGHERGDIVRYHQESFIPVVIKYEARMRKWEKDGVISELTFPTGEKPIEEWYQDKVTFYAHDRRHSGWKHIDAGSDP
ncbi:hypothetical protein PAXRUDRAFT_18429 [Paxillus rubicundulus Ve08.2h10]|uniref:Uncharacterized protein n=1 Tax=Paxillus rubicundulus Ve08.2h10 TaxID=930991 RepID=A0A0D0BY74_9AGAM|nr:hypothetical protein PAXRUDRAFT_18429 [Paxillus rubicundulus Ve08.2h10]